MFGLRTVIFLIIALAWGTGKASAAIELSANGKGAFGKASPTSNARASNHSHSQWSVRPAPNVLPVLRGLGLDGHLTHHERQALGEVEKSYQVAARRSGVQAQRGSLPQNTPMVSDLPASLVRKLSLIPSIIQMKRDALAQVSDPEVHRAQVTYRMDLLDAFAATVLHRIGRGENPVIRNFGYGSLVGGDRDRTVGGPVHAKTLRLPGWRRWMHAKIASNCHQQAARAGIDVGQDMGSMFVQYTGDASEVIGVGLLLTPKQLQNVIEREHYYEMLPALARDNAGQEEFVVLAVPTSKKRILKKTTKKRWRELSPNKPFKDAEAAVEEPYGSQMQVSRVYEQVVLNGADQSGLRDEMFDSTYLAGGVTLRKYMSKFWVRDNIKTGRLSHIRPETAHAERRELQEIDTSTRVYLNGSTQ